MTMQNLVMQGDMPHLIIYGPEGSGKKTRVNCLLAKLYGPSALRPTHTTFSFKHNSTEIEVHTRSSRNHIEIMPSDYKHNDVVVLMKVMKETAASAMSSDAKNHFLTFVIYEAESMTTKAQAALRRTMEKYSNNIRLVFVCVSTSKLIPALKSRCLMIRNPAPTEGDIFHILNDIVKKEGFKNVSENSTREIAKRSSRNLRKAILSCMACAIRNEFSEALTEEHWKTVVADGIVKEIWSNRTFETVKRIRNVFYELLQAQVPGPIIIKEVLWQILRKMSDEHRLNKLKVEEVTLELKEKAVECDRMMSNGDRTIIYLEGFIVKMMLGLEKLLG